jgi:hypothetical protein
MQELRQNLRAFYRRQADRLLALAEECDDPNTTGHLLAMAKEYIDKLERIPVDATPNASHGIDLTFSNKIPGKMRGRLVGSISNPMRT